MTGATLTRPHPETFHEQRRTGIGGSDIAAIMGLDPYRGPADVWDEKMGLRPRSAPSRPAQAGLALEPIIRRLYEEATGRRVRRSTRLRRHPKDRWLIAHVDGIVEERPAGIFEAKAPGMRHFAKIKREGLPAAWILQLQHYLLTLGVSWGSYGVLQREQWSFVHFDVERDDELCAEIADRAAAFWVDHVEKMVRPEEGPTPPAVEIPIQAGEAVMRDDPEWAEAVAALAEAKEIRKAADALEADAQRQLVRAMGSAAVVQGAGHVVMHKVQSGRKTYDWRALEAIAPLDPLAVQGLLVNRALMTAREIAEIAPQLRLDLTRFAKEGTPFRSLRLYPLRGEREEE